jgi:hypothetical protein
VKGSYWSLDCCRRKSIIASRALYTVHPEEPSLCSLAAEAASDVQQGTLWRMRSTQTQGTIIYGASLNQSSQARISSLACVYKSSMLPNFTSWPSIKLHVVSAFELVSQATECNQIATDVANTLSLKQIPLSIKCLAIMPRESC